METKTNIILSERKPTETCPHKNTARNCLSYVCLTNRCGRQHCTSSNVMNAVSAATIGVDEGIQTRGLEDSLSLSHTLFRSAVGMQQVYRHSFLRCYVLSFALRFVSDAF